MGGGPRWLEGGSESSDDELATPACSDSRNLKSVTSCEETGEGNAAVTFPPICFGSLPASQGVETLEPLVLQAEKTENNVPDTVNCNSPVVVVAEADLKVEGDRPETPRLADLEDAGEQLERVSVSGNVVPEVAKVFQAGDIRGLTLHRLMHLRADELDQSSVAKIILPPDEIEKFCNEAMLHSAACCDGQTLLDFNALNNVSVHAVGLYGSKKVLARIFSKLGFHTVVSSMLGCLEVGIYGFLHEGLLFIFYWHEGERMLEASRKDVSCNFIRYVTDLCATVYICLEDENDVAFCRMPCGRSTAASTKQRVQRLQISVVRQSENDVKLREGFNIGPVPTSSCWKPSLRFAGGVHRCAFLTSSVVSRTTVARTHQKDMEIQNLAQVVEEWSASFNLDCTRLPYPEFCLFLEHAGLEGSRDYGLLRESFKARRNRQTEELLQKQKKMKSLGFGGSGSLRQLELAGTLNLKRCFEMEERQFVTRLQKKLSRGTHREQCLFVQRCFLQCGQKEARNIVSDCSSEGETSDKLEVHYVIEQTYDERIAWGMAELSPMPKDLRGLKYDSEDFKKCLLTVDPTSQRLLQVVAVKSGQVLVFVEDLKEPGVGFYVLPSLGVEIDSMNPVTTFKRGYDLVAVDEVSKLVGLYDRKLGTVDILRLDESFHPSGWSGVTLNLYEYYGIGSLTSISFIPGRKEMLVVDEEVKVRVFEISQPAMLRPGHIRLPGPAHKICVSPDGSFFVALYKSVPMGPSEAVGGCKIEVYLLDESMSHLKTLLLDYAVADIKTIDATIVELGSEVHLVLVDASRPDRGIWSEVIEITAASDVCQLQHVDRGSTAISSASLSEKVGHGCPALDYVYQIFEKYATSPPLIQKTRDLHLHLVFAGESKEKLEALKRSSVRYVNAYMDKLERDTGKDFLQLRLAVSAGTVDSYILHNFLVESTEDRNSVNLGDWVQQLVCLVPIQLARAENNTLRLLVDGLQHPNLKYADAVGLAQALRFGFYDTVLAHWSGNIKVISSVGKESSGKSYLLNHLAGSLFDVAEGRCTDGVWMTMRASESCLYVLLDFEGLGSLKRSEQEDMLLFTLNAAVSNLTIFNKKEAHLDKETEAVFKRFPKRVDLVKEDSRLFKGLFYMAIKDVDASDVDGLKARFLSKIQQIRCESQVNILTKMYGGLVEIAWMPPFQRSEYHDSVVELAAAVEELEPVHRNGNTLAADLKLVMAQIASKDWSPLPPALAEP